MNFLKTDNLKFNALANAYDSVLAEKEIIINGASNLINIQRMQFYK